MAFSSGVDVKMLSTTTAPDLPLDTYTHMQRVVAEKIGGFMETATAKSEPVPPDRAPKRAGIR